ncbi:hypothetical protein TH25_13100 [Thalassospira profundimaris]|uniref:Uncharacterized protein n=1 Tax=Thalassospira profundimaris TaxID=502049 RepID=A0A367X8F9_9PROT|nr:hypothetical protein [Thalassospira profundimaris]RCK49934.1 hypothetical protein TH25_13100 [Thalassospira profundimaris]
MGQGWIIRSWQILPGLLLALLLAGGEKQDMYQVDICRVALPGVENAGLRFRLLTWPDMDEAHNRVTLIYQILPDRIAYRHADDSVLSDNVPVLGEGAPAFAHRITCQFSPTPLSGAHAALVGIETSRFGPLPASQLALLDRFWINQVGQSALDSFDDENPGTALANIHDRRTKTAFGL